MTTTQENDIQPTDLIHWLLRRCPDPPSTRGQRCNWKGEEEDLSV